LHYIAFEKFTAIDIARNFRPLIQCVHQSVETMDICFYFYNNYMEETLFTSTKLLHLLNNDKIILYKWRHSIKEVDAAAHSYLIIAISSRYFAFRFLEVWTTELHVLLTYLLTDDN